MIKNGFLVHSVAQGHKASTDMIMSCKFCKKVLYAVKAGGFYTTDEYGPCNCSWGCCEKSLPGNKDHNQHLVWNVIDETGRVADGSA